jgi:excisionase family DNA binding protein
MATRGQMSTEHNSCGYLSIRDAANETGLSEGFWRKAVFAKRITYYKLGRVVRIARQDLRAWVEAQRIAADTSRKSEARSNHGR